MVPHLKIEEVMSRILDDAACVVTGVPDESKGERLVAFYSEGEPCRRPTCGIAQRLGAAQAVDSQASGPAAD